MIEILCRFDARDQAPVVFLSDTINGKQIQVWREGQKPAYVPLDYYKMTAPLSAADERVLMERFKDATGKQDQVVNIRHRLPRNSRPLPNMLATGTAAPVEAKAAPTGERRKSSAHRIEDQKAPEAPQGAPKPEDKLTPVAPLAALVTAPVAPAADGLLSTAIWGKIEQLNARIQLLTSTVTDLTTNLQAAITDLETAKVACQQTINEYNAAIDAESAEQMRRRQEMLAQLSAQVAPGTVVVPAVADTTPVAPVAKTPAPVVTIKKTRKPVPEKKVTAKAAPKAKAEPAAKEAPAPAPTSEAAPAQQ